MFSVLYSIAQFPDTSISQVIILFMYTIRNNKMNLFHFFYMHANRNVEILQKHSGQKTEGNLIFLATGIPFPTKASWISNNCLKNKEGYIILVLRRSLTNLYKL